MFHLDLLKSTHSRVPPCAPLLAQSQGGYQVPLKEWHVIKSSRCFLVPRRGTWRWMHAPHRLSPGPDRLRHTGHKDGYDESRNPPDSVTFNSGSISKKLGCAKNYDICKDVSPNWLGVLDVLTMLEREL